MFPVMECLQIPQLPLVTNGYAQNAQYRGDVNAGYLTTRYNYNPMLFKQFKTFLPVTGGILDITTDKYDVVSY